MLWHELRTKVSTKLVLVHKARLKRQRYSSRPDTTKGLQYTRCCLRQNGACKMRSQSARSLWCPVLQKRVRTPLLCDVSGSRPIFQERSEKVPDPFPTWFGKKKPRPLFAIDVQHAHRYTHFLNTTTVTAKSALRREGDRAPKAERETSLEFAMALLMAKNAIIMYASSHVFCWWIVPKIKFPWIICATLLSCGKFLTNCSFMKAWIVHLVFEW